MGIVYAGTTPTVTIKFKKINVSTDLDQMIMNVKQCRTPVIERDLTTATIDTEENSVSWVLTQEETFKLRLDMEATFGADWFLRDGTVGTTKIGTYMVQPRRKRKVFESGE